MVVVILTLLVALLLGELVRRHPPLNGPVQAAMTGVMAMLVLMSMLVAVTR